MGRVTTGAVGRCAEQSAFDYLVQQGLTPVARNFRCRGGEIDLIMQDGNCLAFIEVRFRASTRFAEASHTVDRRKQRKLIRTAALFVARNRRFRLSTMRFDVVAIVGAEAADIQWIADAFRPGDSAL